MYTHTHTHTHTQMSSFIWETGVGEGRSLNLKPEKRGSSEIDAY